MKPFTAPDGITFEELQRLYLERTLLLCGGDKEKTAVILGVSRQTVYNKLAEYKTTKPMKGK